MMNHEVRTYNAEGKLIYTESFKTAEQAYAAYLDIIDTHENKMPKELRGRKLIVARFADGKMMTRRECVSK